MEQDLKSGKEEFDKFMADPGLRQAARFRVAESIAAINCHDWADTACVAMIVNHGLGMLAAVVLTFEREMNLPSDVAKAMVMENWDSYIEDIREQEKAFNERRNPESTDSRGTDTEPPRGETEGVS